MNIRQSNVVALPTAQPASVVEPLRLRYPSEIEHAPPPPHWLLDGMLLPGTVCLLTGASTIGKSLAAQQMLTAIALGREWMGRQTEQARCLAFFCEDRSDQLDRRALSICEHYDVHPWVLDRELAWDAREDRDSVLWETEFGRGKPTEFWYQVFGGRAGQPGLIGEDGYRVVLFDTAAAVYQGNHNAPEQVSRFLRALTREAVRHDCVIIVNAHPSKGSPSSYGGTAQWLGGTRFAFNISRPPPGPGQTEEDMTYGSEGLKRIFRSLGQNYGATPRPEKWRWDHGVFVVDEEETATRQKRTIGDIQRKDIQYRLLIGLKRAIQNGVQVPADEMAARSLPNLARRCSDGEINWVPLNELYLAQEALLQSGMLKRVAVGKRCLLRPHDGPNYPGEEIWSV